MVQVRGKKGGGREGGREGGRDGEREGKRERERERDREREGGREGGKKRKREEKRGREEGQKDEEGRASRERRKEGRGFCCSSSLTPAPPLSLQPLPLSFPSSHPHLPHADNNRWPLGGAWNNSRGRGLISLLPLLLLRLLLREFSELLRVRVELQLL